MYHIRNRHSVLLALFMLASGMVACGDGGGNDGNPDPNDPKCTCDGAQCGIDTCGKSCGECAGGEFCSSGACALAEGCDLIGFTATSQAAYARFAGGQTRMRFVASQLKQVDQEVDDLIYDKLIIEINLDTFWGGGAPAAGTFDLVGTSETGSPLFVRGFEYCTELACAFPYVVEAGSLELSAPGAPGSALQGVIKGLKLKQVRIIDGAIHEFSNGKSWCVGDFRLNTQVPELPSASGACLAAGSGQNIGDNIRNFTLTNCLGEPIDLHERCAKSEALWIIASAGWCGACETFVPEAAARAASLADDGLDLIVVVGENTAGAKPSLEYCMDYAGSHDLDPRQTYIDHDGTNSWATLFGAINNYGNGSIGLPYNIVLDGRSMEYMWNSATGGGDLYEVQQGLMDRE